jgi:CTP:molybdopterin cytidylyltransferase MocA
VVLAAGEGKRFGGRKLLAPLRGRPLLQHALAAIDLARMEGILEGGLAVVPAGDADLKELVEGMDLLAVENADPSSGLSRSLQLGLAALEREDLPPPAGAALVLLGDQPLVRSRVIGDLVRARRAGGGPFVRPRYAAAPDQPGHPVLLDRSVWHFVRDLQGDAGLGQLLARHSEWVTVVDVTGANPDVDARADLEALERRL